MTALSELQVRIEEQKLTFIITRLIDHWGINPKSIIPMHDGAMISLRNLHPRKELSKIDKPTIDQTVLEDVTLYVRKTLGVFLKLTVKKGHEATELICGVPWPSIECLNETPPVNIPLETKWLPHKNAFLLMSPKIIVTRADPTNIPIHNTITSGDKTKLFNPVNDTQTRVYRGTITLQRAISLCEIYKGSDELFAPELADLLTFYIQLDDKSFANGMATTHPELHEFIRDTFRIQTCLTTPLNFPLNMDIEPKNTSAPSHLYPLPPQFTNILGSPNREHWTTHLNTKRNTAYCIHHQADIHIVNYCKMELISLAENRCRGIILIETKNISTITKIPSRHRSSVRTTLICSIPPFTIFWTNHKGENINPSDNTNDKLHGWSTKWNNETEIEEIISPEHDGRWDLPRSSLTPLNKYTVYMLLFHHHDDEIQFTHKNTRHLSDILSRISAPIPPGIQFENKIPILHFHQNQQSLALRHQPHIPSDPLDIYRSLRDCQFFPGDIPKHDSYSPSFKTFQPLLELKSFPLIPDGHIPTQLINYCATKNNVNPNDDATSIIAVITQCTMKLENERREQILKLMYWPLSLQGLGPAYC
jgi:hypothetical protein